MPGTRRKQQPAQAKELPPQQQQPEAAAQEDDDAPEEIALSSGRAMASQQQHAERQGRAAVEEQRRTKRKATQERNQQQKRAKEEQRQAAAHAEEAPEAAPSGPAADQDLLPSNVLEALQARGSLAERQARMVSQALQAAADPAAAAGHARRRAKLQSFDKGPVTVTVLRRGARRQVDAAANFKREQLLGGGARVQRSHDMLRPATAARHGPAAKFT